jgi:signal transduction histidine kinase
MEKNRAKLRISFSIKVIVPMVTIMVFLLAVTVWMVNRRLTEQFEADAATNLSRAETEFKNFQKFSTRNLVQRFRNLRNEPRYRALIQSGNLPTYIHYIQELPDDQGVDIALLSSAKAEVLASAKREPRIPLADFEAGSLRAVKRALLGEDTVDTVRVGDRLFDVVSIPAAGGSGAFVGALTFGSEIRNSDLQEFALRNGSQIVLLADDRVISSTIRAANPGQDFVSLFKECATVRNGAIKRTSLAGERYFCSAGKFETLNGDGKLGYLLLSSYEQPLQTLQTTKQMLQWVSAFGILLGTTIIWLLVRKVTEPLRVLSASAEAVGKGDFSHRVSVRSSDECGELAAAFNQMTENLQRSHQQLENTVETLKTTQAQLIQSEKLSGIGEFVAGVAHELNNPLTSVMGFSELLSRADGNAQNKRHLDMIHKSAQRCHKIVQSLLSFARRRAPERKLANLNELVEGAIEFLQYQLRTSNIEVTTQLDPKLPTAMVDPHQLQQVFLNILNNARQAIENHQPKGAIRITTETCGHNLRIVFNDDGPGISEQNLSKVFDPFFTTKDVGKGTGLGLSLCYGIIKEHGGNITVRSKPGDGASFIIELPWAIETAAPAPKADLPPASLSHDLEGIGKKVLVIDDEEPILQMISETLSEHGYQVDVARDGEAALRHLDETPYDLTLCDWKMPGLNGQQIFERVRAAHPLLSERMIFFTGDIINEKTQEFLRETKKVCLSKPFSLVEFHDAVVKALATT